MHRSTTALLLALASAATVQADSGLNIVVILDNSGSMAERMPGGGSRMDAAKRSLQTVLERTPDDANVGVVLLNPATLGEDWLIPLGPVDTQAAQHTIERVRAQGPTPLGGAMKQGADALLELRDTQRYGDYKLLVVSDGEATDGQLVERYLPEVQSRGLLVDVIGVAMGRQHSLATRANTYRNAEDPASLEQAISAVVLGESTADSDSADAGESDFEVLAPIPGELAAAALAALTTQSNEPIDGAAAPVNIFPPGAQPLGNLANQGAPNQNVPQGNGEGGLSVNVVIVGFVIFFVLVKVLAAAAKQSH